MPTAHHPHTLAAAAHFGLTIPTRQAPPATPALSVPPPTYILLLTGPSASGKTTALRALTARAKKTHTIINLDTIKLHPIPAVAHFPKLSAHSAMLSLAAAGLADARAFISPPANLSTGQRARLTLAIALSRAASTPRPPLLIADEFAANLDPCTAATVARLLRKAITRTKAAAAIATPRTDITAPLAPNTIVTFSNSAPSTLTHHAPRPSNLHLTFNTGDKDDYLALAPLHYLPGTPATIDQILTARAGKALAAVLTISRPTLNSAHRQLARPNRYTTTNKPADARRINRELRTISRVIVDPRFTGQRVATRLVKHYLNRPLTPCTEAVAAMGTICPFFARAGMTPYTLPPPLNATPASSTPSSEPASPANSWLTPAPPRAHSETKKPTTSSNTNSTSGPAPPVPPIPTKTLLSPPSSPSPTSASPSHPSPTPTPHNTTCSPSLTRTGGDGDHPHAITPSPAPRAATAARLTPPPHHILPHRKRPRLRHRRPAQTPPQARRRPPHRPQNQEAKPMKIHPPAKLIQDLTPIFNERADVTADQLSALVSAIDDKHAQPILSACCRAIALRSLLSAASQQNNAEAARRAAMTLLERFPDSKPEDQPLSLDHPDVIAHTRALLQQDEPNA